MTEEQLHVNPSSASCARDISASMHVNPSSVSDISVSMHVNTIAPLTNVALCLNALEQAIHRPAHLPGLVSFYGPSGYGKTSGAAFAAVKHNAYHLECKSTWTKKAFLSNLMKEMGMVARGTIPDMADAVAEQLSLSGRPLIIDEFDHLVVRRIEELVRDLYEGSNAPILLIGEENLEANLRFNERFHNRILRWVPAQPAGLDDAQLLRRLYCPDVEVGDDILQKIVDITRGCTRRISINLYTVHSVATEQGLGRISLAEWGDRPFYTGNAPKRRV